MTGIIADQPEWMTELADDCRQSVRSQIVFTVRQYCITMNKSYRDVWRTVYERFEKETGIMLADTKGTKLDVVQSMDKLGDLLRAAQIVTACRLA
jgi:hypothetical protein